MVNPVSAKKPQLMALADLKPENITLEDISRLPEMTSWFAPVLLIKLLWRVIVSEMFGQYADRRLIEASLDAVTPEEHVKRATSLKIQPDDDGAVWIDYVSDLGDGFDATYAIATLLARPALDINATSTKRGALLVMGGDEVYPTALREDYRVKLRLPYALAWPVPKEQAAMPLFALPGNHDWYDGLVNFLALFCREKGVAIGGWKTQQRRSYFAVKLTENWWLWGIDIALVKDMDQPQADYFEAIVAAMPQNANIVLCSAEPGWYSAEAQSDSYKSLSFAALIARRAKKDLKIPVVLSGDSHHYARYLGDGSHYITSGGGGAFLHGTMELKTSIEAKWLQSPKESLHLESCYPSKEESKKLLAGNLDFGDLNPSLTYVFAAIYLLATFLLTSAPIVDLAFLVVAVFVAGFWGYGIFQEKSWKKTVVPSVLHALAHSVVIFAFVCVSWLADARLMQWLDWHWLFRLMGLAVLVVPLGSVLSGLIYGWSLRIGCQWFDISHNDAFSAMRLNSHRHFVRLKIKDQTVTVYPIKLENIPLREHWKLSPKVSGTVQPIFEPIAPLVYGFIEEPIVVNARAASSTSEIKAPTETDKPTV